MAFSFIGAVPVNQIPHHFDHFGDVPGGARFHRRLKAAQRLDVGVVARFGFRRHLGDGVVERHVGEVAARPVDDLVVDIGDVADVGDVVGAVEVAEQPIKHVEDDDRAGIADMGVVVDGRPAHIHAHIGRIDRLKILLVARQRVVELQPRETGLRVFTHKSPLARRRGRSGSI